MPMSKPKGPGKTAKPKKLTLNKETLKDLDSRAAGKVKGGRRRAISDGPSCPDLGCE